ADSQARVVAAIVGGEAPALTSLADTKTSLPAAARRALDRLLAKCLAKDPDHRWQTAADLASELQWVDEERVRAAEPSAFAVNRRSPMRERVLTAIATAAVAALAVVGYRWYPRPAPPPEPVTFTIDAPAGEMLSPTENMLAVSPDGTQVAFTTG